MRRIIWRLQKIIILYYIYYLYQISKQYTVEIGIEKHLFTKYLQLLFFISLNKIALFHLPPYSPEYNPDEYLNNDLKRNIGSQAMVNNVSELESNTNDFMKSLSDDPDHVKAYFDHASLSKYKLD